MLTLALMTLDDEVFQERIDALTLQFRLLSKQAVELDKAIIANFEVFEG